MLINNKKAVQNFSSANNLTAMILNYEYMTFLTKKQGTVSNVTKLQIWKTVTQQLHTWR
jgi:hypothetical protein